MSYYKRMMLGIIVGSAAAAGTLALAHAIGLAILSQIHG